MSHRKRPLATNYVPISPIFNIGGLNQSSQEARRVSPMVS